MTPTIYLSRRGSLLARFQWRRTSKGYEIEGGYEVTRAANGRGWTVSKWWQPVEQFPTLTGALEFVADVFPIEEDDA